MTPNKIQTTTPAPEPTPSELTAKQLIADSDLALERLAGEVRAGYVLLWGTPDNPTPREEVIETLEALGADKSASIFARHAAVVAMLLQQGMATAEPWETVTPYAVSFEGGVISVGEDLNEAWQS